MSLGLLLLRGVRMGGGGVVQQPIQYVSGLFPFTLRGLFLAKLASGFVTDLRNVKCIWAPSWTVTASDQPLNFGSFAATRFAYVRNSGTAAVKVKSAVGGKLLHTLQPAEEIFLNLTILSLTTATLAVAGGGTLEYFLWPVV